MPTTYTIDASVFINAFNPAETGHTESRRLLTQLRTQAAPLFAPTLLLPAVALRYGCILVTLDREQYRRLASLVPTRTPAEVLSAGA